MYPYGLAQWLNVQLPGMCSINFHGAKTAPERCTGKRTVVLVQLIPSSTTKLVFLKVEFAKELGSCSRLGSPVARPCQTSSANAG